MVEWQELASNLATGLVKDVVVMTMIRLELRIFFLKSYKKVDPSHLNERM